MNYEFQKAIKDGRLSTASCPQGFRTDDLSVGKVCTDQIPGVQKGELFVVYLYGTISNGKCKLIQRVGDAVPLTKSINVPADWLAFVEMVNSPKLHEAIAKLADAPR